MKQVLWLLFLLPMISGGVLQDDPSGRIDQEIDQQLKTENIKPAGLVDDYEFFRRIHLDLLGRFPRSKEIRAFVQSRSKTKRAEAVDRLLQNSESGQYFADRWIRLLLTHDYAEADPFCVDFAQLRQWMQQAWTDNLGYDKFVEALLTAEGDRDENPAANYLLKYAYAQKPPINVTSRVSQIFMGTQIQCAQCHDHPYEKWTQEDFWGMAAFFGRLRSDNQKTFGGLKTRLVQLKPVRVNVVAIEEEDRTATPRFLDGRIPDRRDNPRNALVRFMRTMEGDRFAKAFVNREWARLMGRGLIEPRDHLPEKSRASHPNLLKYLTEEFKKSGYDMRRFVRAVILSRAYQRSCRPVKNAEPGQFAYRIIKPQGPIEFLNNFEYALDLNIVLQEFYRKFQENKQLPERYKNKTVFRLFLMKFVSNLLAPAGRQPEDMKHLGTVQLALKLMNNHDLQNLVKAHWGHLKKTFTRYETPEERVEELFLTLLSRPPDRKEKKYYMTYLRARQGSNDAYEDIYWVLLNSPDFFFNH